MSTDSSSKRPKRTSEPLPAGQVEKLAEVIARSQHNYRELIDNLDQALFTLSLKGEIRVANLRLAEILDASFPEMIGHSLSEFVESPTEAEVARALPLLLEKGVWSGTVPVRLKRDKELRYFSCWLQTVEEDGRVASVTGWARDVSQQRAAETRFAELFESLREGIIFATPEGEVLDANPALVRLLGYDSKEELQRNSFRNMYAEPADRDALIRELEQKGAVHDREIVLRRKDGKQLRCLTSGFGIRDASGRMVRLQGTIVDITERKEIEKRLHEEREFRRRVVSDFPDLITVIDHNLRFTFVSEKAQDILGREPEYFIGKQIGTKGKPEENEKLKALIRSILSGEQRRGQLEFSLPHTDGTWRTLVSTVSPLFDERGKISGAIASARDVTEARRLERQLHKEQEFARRLVECFPHLIVVLDREGRFTFVSERIRDTLGVAPEEYTGKRIGQRTDSEGQRKLKEMLQDIISGRKRQVQIEIQARHADGSMRSMQVNASALYDEKGEISGVVSAGQDVTESRRIEQQLAQKEKFASMGQMMAGAAHELNNPLTAILGVTDLLRERATDDVTRRQVELVLTQARRAANIVQNLLAFSRPVTLGRSTIRVGDVVQEALRLEKASLDQKRIRIATDLPDDVPSIEGDSRLLKEVFLNIITNAEQAMPPNRDRGSLSISLAHAGNHIRVTFADDGVGIPAENLGKIFDPFFTTKRPGGGSGLGLTICLAVVKEHGGRIEAESAPGAGSKIHVFLPIASTIDTAAEPEAAAPDVEAKPAPAGSEALRGHSVLVVDDEESIREIIEEGLSARGMKIEAAASSEAALAYLEKSSCDAILCDFNLPGMSGEKLFEWLHGKHPGKVPRFIFMTGELVDAALAQRYQRRGAAILQKPFHISGLITLLTELLKGQPAQVS